MKIGTHQIEDYQGIEDLPMHRKSDFDLALFVEAETAGGGAEGFETLIVTAYKHLQANAPDKVGNVLANLLQTLQLAKERRSQLPVAAAAWVRTLDGRDVSDLSAEQVAALLDVRLSPYGVLLHFAREKKNGWMRKWRSFFQTRRAAARQNSPPNT